MNEIIALDIDGTITKSSHDLHPDVRDFLNSLIARDFYLVFITGRTFAFAQPIFRDLKGTFYLGVQNGAALYEMPSQKQLSKHYLPGSVIPDLEKFFTAIQRPLMIEMGHEHKDLCYYRPQDFSESEMKYINYRKELSLTTWQAVESFTELDLKEFAVAKYFADKEVAHGIAQELHDEMGLNTVVINDGFKPGSFLAHVNRGDASKGRALREFHDRLGQKLQIIAAGDDYNDLAMLMESDYKIVMGDAPDDLKKIADVIAKPADQQGIIEAINERIS